MTALDEVKQLAASAGKPEASCTYCYQFSADAEDDMGRCNQRQDAQLRYGICLSWSNVPAVAQKLRGPEVRDDGTRVLFAGADTPLEAPEAAAGDDELACAEPGCDGLLRIRFSHKLNRRFYGCERWPKCSGILPANDDGTPSGRPRTRALQGSRNRAHGAFDTLWKGGHTKRADSYAWLAEVMAIDRMDAHMFRMDEQQCQQVIELVDMKGPGTPYWEPWVERRTEHNREKKKRKAAERRKKRKAKKA